MTQSKRIGIIGTGRMAATMMEAMQTVPGLTPVSVLSSDKGRAKAFAERHGLGYSFDRVTEFLAKDGLDAVYIANANTEHFESAKAVLQAGLPALVEKPLTLSVKDTSQLWDLSQQMGAVLMENFWTLTLPAYRDLFYRVETSAHGAVRQLTFDFSFPTEVDLYPGLFKRSGGGVLLDRAVYGFAAAYRVLGPVRQLEVVQTQNSESIDTAATLLLAHEGGGTSVIAVSFESLGHNSLLVSCDTAAYRLTPSLAAETFSTNTWVGSAPEKGQGPQGRVSGLKQTLKQSAVLRRLKSKRGGETAFLSYGRTPYTPVLQEFERLIGSGNTESPLFGRDLSVAVAQMIELAQT